ncbi:MAG: insulinase family protein [Zoogloeaceae bacterium]|nr:insulinase family protein [Zoogloeaceae bacterium]
MKRLGLSLFGGVMAWCLGAGSSLAAVDIQTWIAPSGARVFLVESHTLPMVDIQVDFQAGGALDPGDKAGVAALTQALLDGGAGGLDEAAISDRLADLGARLGGGADDDRASVSLRTLADAAQREPAVALLRTLLTDPAFPEAVVERERARTLAGLKDAETRPDSIAARRFAAAIYGDHPYGNDPTVDSVARIHRDDLVSFHRRYYRAPGATVTLVGDIQRPEAARIAQLLTEALPGGESPAPLPVPQAPGASVIRIAHPSAQAHVLMGMPVLARDDPDYFPLLVGNYILGGGGFVSRLTHEVRERRGLAYSAYSYLHPAQVAGPFQIGLQTKVSQADLALGVVNETVRAFLDKGPTPAEVTAAKSNIVNGFGLRLDSNRKILDYVAVIGFYRLPLDWLDAYPKAVSKVTGAAIQDAFRRRVDPGHLVTVVVGGTDEGGGPVAPGAGK